MSTMTRQTGNSVRAGTQPGMESNRIPRAPRPAPINAGDPAPGGDPNADDNPDHNPDDDPEDDPHPEPLNDDQDEPNLANAIRLLAQNVGSKPKGNRTKVREPDTFDGSDPKKLRPFILQLELNFRDRPENYLDDENKVNFALSYLKGAALDYFEPEITEPRALPPDWLFDYDTFKEELRLNFGPYDPVEDVESELTNLRMLSDQRLTEYIVKFYQVAHQVRWGDAPLRHQFYRGLPARIKDEITHVRKPDTLPELKTLAQSIDARYWSRRQEQDRENRAVNRTAQTNS